LKYIDVNTSLFSQTKILWDDFELDIFSATRIRLHTVVLAHCRVQNTITSAQAT